MTGAQPTEAVVDRVSRLLHREIGLRPEPSLRGRLRRCIRDAAVARGQDFDGYVDTLLLGGDALQGLLDAVTVQESAFFRHPEQFDLLAGDVLQRLSRPVTIWSAACANGQEAFSLAMLLKEQGIDGSVIASDLSSAALQRTDQARYSQREVAGLSPQRVASHLTRVGGDWVVNDDVRHRVSTLQHNLLDPVPGPVRATQIIFCRNVLIYFSAEHAATLLDRFADDLPAASLFLGAAESIWQVSDRFETVRAGNTFSYRVRPAVPHPQSLDAGPGSSGHPPRTRTASDADIASRHPVSARPRPSVPTARRDTAPLVPPPESDATAAASLRRAGEAASAAGNSAAAVVAFRKCTYLAPHDPMAHLHLGLALESTGDRLSAHRAYRAARQAITHGDPTDIGRDTEGYTLTDLVRLLDSKQRAMSR